MPLIFATPWREELAVFFEVWVTVIGMFECEP